MNEMITASENVNKLFSILNITKVVYVDDYISEISFEEVITSEKRVKIIESVFPDIIKGDEEIENEILRKRWEEVTYEEKQKIKQIIDADTQESIDSKVIPAFMDLMPEGSLYPMSPERWEHEKEGFLKDNSSTLFLFDQDLKNKGREEDGIMIIKNITKNGNTICGLFTKKALKSDYLKYRDKMSVDYDIPKDNFFVIPKENTIENIELFVHLFKLTLLGRMFTTFKNQAKEIIENVNSEAIGKINQVSIEDFEHIIFRVPLKEGAWEPDMFFRIYSGFQRRDFIGKACSNVELNNAISEIRKVNGISTKPDSYSSQSNAIVLQHNELYEDVDCLNKNHLPIELGDIFEKSDAGDSKKYILLHQPCDLVIRSDGKRSRENKRYALLEVKKMPKEEFENKKKEEKSYIEELWYYSISDEERWAVNFKSVFMIKECILDLCVYNNDGISKYASGQDAEIYGIRPSLIERHIRITKQLKKISGECNKILEDLKIDDLVNKNKIKKTIYENRFQDDLFKVNYNEQQEDNFTLTYNCKRTGRLQYERAIGLLAEYYSVMQRPAYPPDFGQEEK
jgi:hypothetical protein